MTGHTDRALGIAAIVAASALWGTTGVAASLAAPLAATVIGVASMGIGGATLALVFHRSLPAVLRHRRTWPIVALGAVSLIAFSLSFYGSMALAGITLGTVLTICSSPIFAGLLEGILEGRTPSGRWAAAAVLSLAGGALLVTGRSAGGSWLGADAALIPLGVAAGLFAGLAYATYTWCVGLVTRSTASDDGSGRLAAVATVQGVAALPLLCLVPLLSGGEFGIWQSWIPVLYLGLIPMAVGHGLFGWSLGVLRTSTVTLFTLVEPMVASLLAVALVGERLTVSGWTGLALLLAGLAVLSWPERAHAHAR